MKKLILLAVMIAGCIINAGAQTTKVSDKVSTNGTTYVSSTQRQQKVSSDIETGFDWSNGKDDTRYPIYLHKKTRGDNAGQWTVYVFRTSKKTGKEYKYYLPDGEAIAADIMKRKPNLVK